MLKQMRTIQILANNLQAAVDDLKKQYETFSAAFSGEKDSTNAVAKTSDKTSTSRSEAMKAAWAKRKRNAKKIAAAPKVKAAPKAGKIDRSAVMKAAWAKRRANAKKAVKAAAPKAKADHRSNGGTANATVATPDAAMQV